MEYIKRAAHKSTPAPGTPHATYEQGRNKVVVIQMQDDLTDYIMQEVSLLIIDIVVSSSF